MLPNVIAVQTWRQLNSDIKITQAVRIALTACVIGGSSLMVLSHLGW